MSRQKAGSAFLLLLTAAIWGVAFVAQRVGMDYIGPLTFNFVRFLIGGIVLLPVITFFRRGKAKEKRKYTWQGGICCGLALCVGSLFQQYGIRYTTVGKAGFITALYIIIVPILGVFLKKKVRPIIWISALIAVVGFYLLCMSDSLSFSLGDFLILLCALAFSIHILLIDYFSARGDGVVISCIQFFVSAICCGVGAFIVESPKLSEIFAAYIPLLYAGVLSCGVAYTLQIVGQKQIDPTVASLILSLESVIAVLAGWIILGQSLTGREMLGCVFVFLAIILVQLPKKIKKV